MTEIPRRRRRVPSAAEQALWRFAVRDATPLPGRVIAPEPPIPEPLPGPPPETAIPLAVPKPKRARELPRPITLPRLDVASTPGLDARSAERLKRGQLPIEGRLDLHGLTQEAARGVLDGFIAEAYA
ncbi:MAG: hypothetical protein WCC64_14345, partial [Aliidongia sp.]